MTLPDAPKNLGCTSRRIAKNVRVARQGRPAARIAEDQGRPKSEPRPVNDLSVASSRRQIKARSDARSLAVGDFNEDKRSDVATATST
jgi:hypothetical protein